MSHSVKVDALKEQLRNTEREMEEAKAHVYRADGAVQVLKHLISIAEAGESQAKKD